MCSVVKIDSSSAGNYPSLDKWCRGSRVEPILLDKCCLSCCIVTTDTVGRWTEWPTF